MVLALLDGFEEFAKGLLNDVSKVAWDLDMVIAIVVKVEDAVQLVVNRDMEFLSVLYAFALL